MCDAARVAGIPTERVRLDVSIARGLDYYTGTIYETFLDDLPGIGSVCSGGRYDNLAALFTKEKLPGIGASLGLDRLLAAMEELGMVPKTATPASVLVPIFDGEKIAEYMRIGRVLRAAGIATEVFPEARPLAKQFKYADRKGFRLAVIAAPTSLPRGPGKSRICKAACKSPWREDQLCDHVRAVLGSREVQPEGMKGRRHVAGKSLRRGLRRVFARPPRSICRRRDESAARSLLQEASLKSMDFIVYSSQAQNLLVDVKGRRFPSGAGSNRHEWENWATRDDIHSLLRWQSVFGAGFRARCWSSPMILPMPEP